MFDSRRIKRLNDHGYKTGNILYWTEGALRTRWNCALEYAIYYAEEKNTSLLPLITVDTEYAHENIGQLIFLLETIQDLQGKYREIGAKLNVIYGKTKDILTRLVEENNIGMIVSSASYTRFFQDILYQIARDLDIPVVLIDDASLLSPWVASDHEEYAAYTLRKKYWTGVSELAPEKESSFQDIKSIHICDDTTRIVQSGWYQEYLQDILHIDKQMFRGGETQAQKHWENFKQQRLGLYDEKRNDPNAPGTSLLSPYLHFGCISPLQLYHELQSRQNEPHVHAFLEESLVRRELAINMWYYNHDAHNWKCLPDWAIKTLDEDRQKQMSLIQTDDYTREELESGKTHDPLWNAAQHQLTTTGKIHGYVRMYWGKQLTKWFRNWRDAYSMGVYLNDKYALDGCSPNGYAGVAWCFGKHDRPFPPKKTHYGLVRSMTFGGMKKKFDVQKYIEKWS